MSVMLRYALEYVKPRHIMVYALTMFIGVMSWRCICWLTCRHTKSNLIEITYELETYDGEPNDTVEVEHSLDADDIDSRTNMSLSEDPRYHKGYEKTGTLASPATPDSGHAHKARTHQHPSVHFSMSEKSTPFHLHEPVRDTSELVHDYHAAPYTGKKTSVHDENVSHTRSSMSKNKRPMSSSRHMNDVTNQQEEYHEMIQGLRRRTQYTTN
jgi:hypothetical protein